MPLIARDGEKLVSSFTMGPAEWAHLRAQNRALGHLRACCCDSAVICKTSALGTAFFAHKPQDSTRCEHRGETVLHLEAKAVAARAGRALGWDAQVECAAADGSWRADVLFAGSRRIALEIQSSPITPAELQRRHLRYSDAGIQCIWLLAKAASHMARAEMPVFHLAKSSDQILVDHLPGQASPGPLPLGEFIERLLSDRLVWTPWAGELIPLQLWTIKERCRTGLHVSRQIERAVLRLSHVWPGTADVHYGWPQLECGSRANELMTLLTPLPFERDGVSRPRRRGSQMALSYSQGCDVCGKSSWGAKRIGDARLWRTIEVKASAAWGGGRVGGGFGFPYQWWWSDCAPRARRPNGRKGRAVSEGGSSADAPGARA
jgi:hypothetical protein